MIHREILGTQAAPALPATAPLTLRWPDEAACAAFASALAAVLATTRGATGEPIDAAIELRGGLGAGKTTFTRHLLRALGATGRIKSPTYALLEPHATAHGPASHLDFFRFDDPHEWDDAGLRDVYAAPGLKIAEWPERAAALLPPADLAFDIGVATDGSTREVRLDAATARGAAWVEALRR